jgi:hypothetical protein
LLAAACQATGAGEDVLVTTFMEAAFDVAPTAELQLVGELRSDLIWRWDRPILHRVEGVRSPAQEDLARGALAEFARLSGVSVADAAGGEAPNFRLVFDGREFFTLANGQLSTCVATFRGRRDGEASIAVTISTAKPQTAERCMRHELMHAFGFLGHSHRVRSVLSYLHGETALTRWDKVLLASLYDTSIHAGMRREDVSPLLHAIIAKNLARFAD